MRRGRALKGDGAITANDLSPCVLFLIPPKWYFFIANWRQWQKVSCVYQKDCTLKWKAWKVLTLFPSTFQVKCEQYWPNEGTELYGDIEVAVTDWVEFANYSITTLEVCKVSCFWLANKCIGMTASFWPLSLRSSVAQWFTVISPPRGLLATTK